MSAPEFRISRELLQIFDNAVLTYVADISSNAIIAITPIVSLCFVIGILLYSVLVMRGAIEAPISELLGKVFKYSILVALTLEAGIYQSEIADTIISTADELSIALMPGNVVISGSGLGTILDKTMEEGIFLTYEAFDKVSLYDSDKWVFALIGAIIFLLTAAVTAMGLTLIIVSKIFLSIAVGLGPIFIIAFAFDATKNFFDRWVSTILAFTFIIVTYSIVSGFLMGVLGAYMSTVELDSSINVLFATGGLVLMLIAFTFVYALIPYFANSITSGSIGGFVPSVRGMVRGGNNAMRGGGAAVSNTYSAGTTVASGVGKTAYAGGALGFPNLTDDDWLYGGSPEKIKQTLINGRQAAMPGWSAILGEKGINDVTQYVLSLSGQEHDASLVEVGKTIYDTNCAACHGADAKGSYAVGAPNLTDDIWLYEGTPAGIRQTLRNGRNGNMPAQKDRLREDKIHLLTAYIYQLSQD